MAIKVWTDGTDTYVAEDVDDIRAIVIELHGSWENWQDSEWEVVPDDKPITIVDVDGAFGRKGYKVDGVNNTVTMTAAQWVTSEGRGMLCSTEY